MTTLQLHHGDCLEKMKSIADKSIDLILCDLPYGCLTGGGGAEKKRRRFKNGVDTGTEIKQTEGTIAGCSWDIKINLELFWVQIKRIRKNEHSPCIHFCSTKFGIDLINSNPNEYRYDLVWVKPSAVGFLSVNKKPMATHEMIYIFSKAGANYNRIDVLGDFKAHGGGRTGSNFIPDINTKTDIKVNNEGKRCAKSCIEINNKKVKGAHPTTKPIDLYKWIIERYSKAGDTILDPTFGSCNSGLAAKELGRNYIGIEMNDAFFDKAKAKNIIV
jgi:site-specific DNA-methyltransferase (adenine-specific)